MRITRRVLGCVVACFAGFGLGIFGGTCAANENDGQQPHILPHILMVTQSAGFVHQSVRRQEGEFAPAELAMRQLADRSGEFTLVCTQDVAKDFTRENLDKYDIVMFYTSGDLPIAEADMKYFLEDWLKQSGHGFIGVHSSSDTYKEFEPYRSMVGGSFNGHPWNQNETVTLTIHEPDHPTMKAFGKEFVIQDEIYQYQHWAPEKVRVLMSLNMAKCKTKRPYHVPVAWVKSWGEGRIYYNNLGHRPETWRNEAFLESLRESIRWITHRVDGPSAPNPDVSARQESLARRSNSS